MRSLIGGQMLKSVRDLAELLTCTGVQHRQGASASELSLATSSGLPRALRIRWDANVPFIVFDQILLQALPTSRMTELECAVVHANFHLPVLGFCIDHDCGTLSYRVSAPTYGGLDPGLVDRLVRGSIATCKEFLPAFQQIVDGRSGAEFSDVYSSLRRQRGVHLVYADSF